MYLGYKGREDMQTQASPQQAHTLVEVQCICFLGCLTTYHRSSDLKEQKLIFSQFWRLEVQDQDVRRAGFFQGIFPWLVRQTSSHVFTSSNCLRVPVQISSFYKNTNHIGFQPTPMTSFLLTYSF